MAERTEMTVYYTALAAFGRDTDEDGLSWEQYTQWSRLTHLNEVVSLDGLINKSLVEPDWTSAEHWRYVVTDENFITGFYTSLDYVLEQMEPRPSFNLLAVIIEPTQDCQPIQVADFDLLGYDLLDAEYGHSALTNCGGFDETFLPTELNPFGLLDEYEKAYDVQRRLRENNPDHPHANTNVIAIWRHKTIGRGNTAPLPEPA